MKSVSAAYKRGMKGVMRRHSYAKITFGNVDPAAARDGNWTANGTASYSEFDTVDYDYTYGETYATVELNRWALDGKSLILPDLEPDNQGYVSNILSDANGDYSTKPVVTREFSQPRIFPGLTLTFDTRSREWPLQVTVAFWLDGEITDSITQTIREETVVFETRTPEIDKVTVTYDKTLPYRFARAEDVLFGVQRSFTNDDIVTLKQTHDVDPLSRRLPQEKMQFTVFDLEHKYDPDNPQGIYAFVDGHSPIELQFGYELDSGEIEWIKSDRYVLNGKPSIKNDQSTFTATGLLGSMTDTFYKSLPGSKNLYDMAVEVLEDAGLTLTKSGQNPWDVDEALKTMYTTAVLPIQTHAQCLQMIAHAARSRLFTDDDNVIHIKPFGVTVRGIYEGHFTDNGHDWYSDWTTVDVGNSEHNSYAALDLNRWALNGNGLVIVPDSDAPSRGFISSILSDENGDYGTVPMFTRYFDVSHDLPVTVIRFETVTGIRPTALEIRYFVGDTMLDSQYSTDFDGNLCYVTSALARGCTKIEVRFFSALPYTKVRLDKVYYRETDFTLDFGSIGDKSQRINKIDVLKDVEITQYSYSASGTSGKLFEGSTSEETLHVEFSSAARDVTITVTGGTLISSNIYGRAADLVLSAGTKSILIEGATLSDNQIVKTYHVGLVGETDNEQNPLITNDAQSDALAEHLTKYLTMRNTYDADYRGNPEMETGDIIAMQTPYTEDMDGLILVDEITFNGALSGKMKVKGLI